MVMFLNKINLYIRLKVDKKYSLHCFSTIKIMVIILLMLRPVIATADWLDSAFIDPSDGNIDLSNWLLEKEGALPVPIIITEPAIGYGAGMAMVYFHDKIGSKKGTPPSISTLAGAATEEGTWFVGGGHMGIWKDDSIRYTGGIGTGLVKMKYYGSSAARGRGIDFETEAIFLSQEVQFRLWESNFFTGASYTFADTKNTFKLSTTELTEPTVSKLPGVNFDSRSAALSFMLNYDSRNNIFTPSEGMAAEIKVMDFSEAWGSDDNFKKYSASLLSYMSLNDVLVLGLRADTETIDGDAPFYSYPFIDMRGIKAMQYQGDEILLGEIELRWALTSRWSLVGFGGGGKAYNDDVKGNSDIIYSKGLGMRYLVASKLGLQMGLDIAKGPDDTAIYMQFGSSWSLK